MDDDAELLYEDLFEDLEDGRAIIKTSVHELEDRIKELSDDAETLRLQARNLQEKNDELSKQNEVLVRNISCLFKTAQMEIARKDKQIRSLQLESLGARAPDRDTPNPLSSRAVAVGKRRPDTDVGNECRKHGASAVVASKAEGKINEPKTSSLAANGAWKQAHQAHAQHQESVEMVDSRKSRDYVDEVRKRSRGNEEFRHESGRRGNERHLTGSREREGAHHRHSFNAHGGPQSNRVKRVCS
ncbi:hypothetical protein GOP47_0023338 [Adiantum capillus-veneris]|uniref:Uncharacterized protein n=1 Tax=Adiantum capillus-veneris TaxID=13818 RepID=A0A9D4Z3A9_ADICA|nr:hypothetical protein GOP47_0023338 [Adiantum capillus-veneris]